MDRHCEFDKENLIAEFQLGILDDKREQEIREHLKSCEICRQTLSELEAITDGLKLTRVEVLPEKFKENLHNRLIEEQKILYSDSKIEVKETQKSKMDIFREIFPLRRFVSIAAMLAVVVLLAGKFGALNTENKNVEDTENISVAINRVNPDVTQEFKEYNSEEEISEDNNIQNENSEVQMINKIPQSDMNENSKEVKVALNENSAEEKTDNSEQAVNKTTQNNEQKTTENTILKKKNENYDKGETAKPTNNETASETENIDAVLKGKAVSGKEQALGGASPSRTNVAVSSTFSGGSGGNNSDLDLAVAENDSYNEKNSDANIMSASLEYYVNVYSIERYVIENSEYANDVTSESILYLSNEDYAELCEKLGVEPKFKETRLADESSDYNVIILVE